MLESKQTTLCLCLWMTTRRQFPAKFFRIHFPTSLANSPVYECTSRSHCATWLTRLSDYAMQRRTCEWMLAEGSLLSPSAHSGEKYGAKNYVEHRQVVPTAIKLVLLPFASSTVITCRLTCEEGLFGEIENERVSKAISSIQRPRRCVFHQLSFVKLNELRWRRLYGLINLFRLFWLALSAVHYDIFISQAVACQCGWLETA